VAEKERVAKYREEAKKKKTQKAKEREKKRKLAKAQLEHQGEANSGDAADAEPSSNASTQFGSNGSKKKAKS
jgi:hypothetical protein